MVISGRAITALYAVVILTSAGCQVTPAPNAVKPASAQPPPIATASTTIQRDMTQRNGALLAAAAQFESAERYEEAATSLMGYAFSERSGDDAQNAAVVERIWRDVNLTPRDRISALAAAQPPTAATAWWQLAEAMQRSSDLLALRSTVADWRRRHSSHPAARWPPAAFTIIESTAPAERLALLLPISGPLANAGQAVRDAIIAALYDAQSKAIVRVYDTNGAAIDAAYELACRDGAQIVVGPLDKPGVAQINALPQRPVPVLALNRLPAGVKGNAGLYQFGLAIEDEAIAIAQRAHEDHLLRVAVISSDVDWSVRAAESFRSQFAALGGTTVASAVVRDVRSVTAVVGSVLLVSASDERMQALSKTIGMRPEFVPRRRSDLDALIVLTDPAQAHALNAAMAYYFAADVPIYAMAQAAGAGSPRELSELEGFRLPELHWLVFPSEIHNEIEAAFPAARSSLAPLYALGVDAFRLSERPDLLLANSPARLSGATGTLQVRTNGVVAREPAWAIVQHGALVALPSVAP